MAKHSEEDEPKPKKKRIAQPGARHRREREDVEIVAVPPPSLESLGQLHLHTESVIQGGPRALIKAHHEAARLSKLFGEEFQTKWLLKTKWLESLEVTHRGRTRVKYAMIWRPRYLAMLAITMSTMAGCRAGRVKYDTVELHKEKDPDFAFQCDAAEKHAVQLLHDVSFKSALEGDCEPVYWQGIQVGHIRKFDNRLRIEMLRAHMPKVFKTPGSKAPITIGDGAQILVCDDETTAALVGMRQTALHDMQEKRANAVVVVP